MDGIGRIVVGALVAWIFDSTTSMQRLFGE